MKLPFWPNGNGHADPDFPDIILETDPAVGPSDGNNGKYHRPSAHYEDREWDLGWIDGRVGQSADAHEQLLLAGGALEREKEIRRARDERAAARAQVAAFENHLKSLNARLDDLRTYYGQLTDRRNRHGSESSVPLALMYLVFGTLLFVADVPLSLTLVAEGFDIPISYRIPGTSTVVLVSQIFSSPLLVLMYLWEAVFLALGIACIGIIVKFFVDAVILRDADEPPLPRATTVGICVAFALFVVCTLCLGQFRAAVRAAQPGASPVDYENWAFTLLTLTFPVVGGFCYSAGWRRLERAKTYYLTSFRLRRLEKEQRSAFKEYSRASEEVGVLEQKLGASGDGLAVSRANLKKNLYLHGYVRGRSVPETRDANETLYGFCERTLNKVLARKVVRNLQDIDG